MWRPASKWCVATILSTGATLLVQLAVATTGGASGGLSTPAAPRLNFEAARNEAAVVDLCRQYVEAQFDYLRFDRDGDGFLTFAQKIRSTPGLQDGLYWPMGNANPESPVGPNFAAASVTEQMPGESTQPFHGYFYKMLLEQGPEAPGGARDYRVNGRLLTGFALVAWPADYRVTGVRSFLVNHLGEVYAKDLGSETSRIAAGMAAYEPDHTWTKVASHSDER
jgi:hypothetical protein